MSKFDQAKMLMQARKLQKELAKTIIEVTAGDGAVMVEITGEQKLKRVHIDPEQVDVDDIRQLEQWVEDAVKDAIAQSQKLAAEKMQPFMGMLGNLGLQLLMTILPKSLTRLIEALGKLPGVGPRSAERFALYLLKSDPQISLKLSEALSKLHEGVKLCPKTFTYIDRDLDVSPLYSDPRRDKQQIAVVAEPFDVAAIEKTNIFHGTYHVLGGLISPIDGMTPERLHITELMRRIDEDAVKEIILATNASVEGETTALYLQQQLVGTNVKLTRLARGMPVGLDLEYADQITLGRALEGRQDLQLDSTPSLQQRDLGYSASIFG